MPYGGSSALYLCSLCPLFSSSWKTHFLACDLESSRGLLLNCFEFLRILELLMIWLIFPAIARTVGHLSKSAEVMKLVNNLMKAPEVAVTMQEFSKEMTKVFTSTSLGWCLRVFLKYIVCLLLKCL